jgi:transposase-like protein
MKGGSEPMKGDTLGRVRTPSAKREEILDAFERSGVSGVEFAALVGVKYPTLASWIQQRRRRGGTTAGTSSAKPVPEVRFLEAAVPAGPAPLELELPGGVRLRVTEPAQVPLVVALLRGLGPC